MTDDWGNDPIVGTHDDWGNDPLAADGDGRSISGVPGESDRAPSHPPRAWGDVAGEALTNLGPSAVKTGEAIYDAVRHPIDTAKSFVTAARGAGQELAHKMRGDADLYDPTPQTQAFDALKGYFADRYGGEDAFKNAIATDPVGVAMDMSAVLTGGASLGAKLPGIGERAADIARTGARITNPALAPTEAVHRLTAPVGNAVADIVGNLGTHTGAEPLKLAYKAGRQGGDAAQAFLDNLRGNAPMEDVVGSAKAALSQMRQNKNAAYRAGMAGVAKDPEILSFEPIDKAMQKAAEVKSYRGRSGTGTAQELSSSTSAVRKDIEAAIDHWRKLDPAEFHTPEGFDALKQQLGDIKDSLPYNTPQRLVAEQAYSAIRNSIVAQAPEYAKVMKDYERASDAISQIERGLSLGKRATVDTSLRKLQSIMRNNVNTNYGYRGKLLDQLTEAGAPHLPYELAGQSLSKLTPRGLGNVEAGAAGAVALASHNPAILTAAPLMSPRLMGETAYGAGAAARHLAPVGEAIDVLARKGAEAAPLAYEADLPRRGMEVPWTVAGQEKAAAGLEAPALRDAQDALLRIANPAPAYKDGGRVDAAADIADQDPSQAQIKAGNYRKGHVKLHGFDITIETPIGAARRGTAKDGTPWENRHSAAHYGYIKRSHGADGEHVDCYIGPHHVSKRIFVVNQIEPGAKRLDEHKVIFGARTLGEAKAIYDEGFSDGSGSKRRWSVKEMTPEALKDWLKKGSRWKPLVAAA